MRWGMDIVGPIGAENCPKKYFLLATDYFTKWIEGGDVQRSKGEECDSVHRAKHNPQIRCAGLHSDRQRSAVYQEVVERSAGETQVRTDSLIQQIRSRERTVREVKQDNRGRDQEKGGQVRAQLILGFLGDHVGLPHHPQATDR